MVALTFDEFQFYAKNAKRVAVFEEIPAGELTPAIIYMLLNKADQAGGVIFEDLYPREGNRYSFICFKSLASFKINNGDEGHPLTLLRDLQLKFAYSTRPEVADLITSAVGFMTYDAIRYFEVIPDRHVPDPSLPILLFNFYGQSLTFNHAMQSILISTVVEVGADPKEDYHQARQTITDIIALLKNASYEEEAAVKAGSLLPPAEVDISDSDYMHRVEKAKDYIRRGDAFQIVISRCFKQNYTVAPFEIYKTLRHVSPAPFMFYFPVGASVLIGASPERLIRVQQQKVTVNPIAGTRKRTGEKTDEAIASDLLNDKKELAEHMMLVDLARNDVGAISRPGTVKVSELLQMKHCSHVSHIASVVTGELQEKYDALDALVANFPPGTLSGAPKIRAMEIIDELETSRRGLYGGAMCRFDTSGDLESCIVIRTAVLKDGIATVRSGAGIVYDSDPFAEACETRQKASAVLDAITRAHGE
jgi:anthranilate synthase component I